MCIKNITNNNDTIPLAEGSLGVKLAIVVPCFSVWCSGMVGNAGAVGQGLPVAEARERFEIQIRYTDRLLRLQELAKIRQKLGSRKISKVFTMRMWGRPNRCNTGVVSGRFCGKSTVMRSQNCSSVIMNYSVCQLVNGQSIGQ